MTSAMSGDGRPADSGRRVSDRALRLFVEAAERGSLTAAADRLGLGQPAVSHAISRLEDAVGTRLLERSRTGVRPTASGAELLTSVGPAFALIDEAVARARASTDDATVSISVSTSLASWWLLPRLPEFKRLHPDVSLRLVTADSDSDIDLDTIDLWIPLGLVDRHGLESTRLCNEVLVPVAAPSIAERLARGADQHVSPGALTDAPLLHLEERYTPRFDWYRWFAHHGVDVPSRLPGDRSNDYSLVIQAALDGQGVALGWLHIVSDLVDQKRLIPLSPPVTTDQPFEVLTRRRQLSTGASALLDWLAERLAGEG